MTPSPLNGRPDGDWVDRCTEALRDQALSPSNAGERLATQLSTGVRRLADSPDEARRTADLEESLIKQWRREGLFDGKKRLEAAAPAQPRSTASRPSPWLGWLPLSAIAVAAMAVLPIYWLASPTDSSGQGEMRGGEATQTIRVGDPQAAADMIEAALRTSGLTVRRVWLERGAIQIQAKVPAEALDARRAIEALGARVPDHGRLDLVIMGR